MYNVQIVQCTFNITPKAPFRLRKWNIYLTNEGNSRIIQIIMALWTARTFCDGKREQQEEEKSVIAIPFVQEKREKKNIMDKYEILHLINRHWYDRISELHNSIWWLMVLMVSYNYYYHRCQEFSANEEYS